MGIVKRTIREWRAYRFLGMEEVANKIGIHPSTYTKWEKHPEDIRMGDVPKLANAFDCAVEEIIFFEG